MKDVFEIFFILLCIACSACIGSFLGNFAWKLYSLSRMLKGR